MLKTSTGTLSEMDSRYFGLTPTQLNLAFFAVVGAVAVAGFVYVGGVSAVREYLGEEPTPPAAVTTTEPTAATTTPTPSPAAPKQPVVAATPAPVVEATPAPVVEAPPPTPTIGQYEAPTGSLEYCASLWGRQHPELTRLDDMIGNADGYQGKLVAIFQVDANRIYVIWNSPGGCSADGQSKPAFCISLEPYVYWIWLLDYCIVPIGWEGG